jgi:hypothetical protein
MPKTRASGDQRYAVEIAKEKRAQLPSAAEIWLRVGSQTLLAEPSRERDIVLFLRNRGQRRLNRALERGRGFHREQVEQTAGRVDIHVAKIHWPEQAPERHRFDLVRPGQTNHPRAQQFIVERFGMDRPQHARQSDRT